MKKRLFGMLIFFNFVTAKAQFQHFSPTTIYPMEYTVAYWDQVNHPDTLAVITNGVLNGTILSIPLPDGEKTRVVAGMFNRLIVYGDHGNLWQSGFYNKCQTCWTPIRTDSLNTPFSSNPIKQLYGFKDTWIALRADSTLWYAGQDDPGIYGKMGTANFRLFKMGSKKYVRADIGGYGVVALRSDSIHIDIWIGNGSGGGPSTYTSTIGTRKFTWISSGNGNQWAYAFFAIGQMRAGSRYGHPMVLGTNSNTWGSGGLPQAYTVFTDKYKQFGLASLAAEITTDGWSTHIIDSLGKMYGGGFDFQGQVGDDTEYVNRYTYPGWPGYQAGFEPANPTSTMRQIGTKGVKYTHLFTNHFFTFYNYAIDANDSVWVWGRCKSGVCAIGDELIAGDQASNHPNYRDLLVPTMVHPAYTKLKAVNWIPPVLKGTAIQTISTGNATISATGHPALIINANRPFDTVGYRQWSAAWTNTVRPKGSAIPTIVTPTAMSSTVTGMTTAGMYIYQLITIDTNHGMNAVSDTVVVTSPGQPAPRN